jgi:hypothetical protein
LRKGECHLFLLLAVALLCAAEAHGQTPPARADDAPSWSFAAAVYGYVVPDDTNYAQPAFTADRDWLHLEARYNYEDRETGSLWVGCNLAGGRALEWELTPMLGAVFGNTDGIAPGYRASLTWRVIEFYSEGEYVFDAAESSDSFFYNWSELALAPAEWFRVGLVTQRTRVYEAERDIERGLLVGASYKGLDVTTYVFDPDVDEPTVVVALAVAW